jgi:hypothetical protein
MLQHVLYLPYLPLNQVQSVEASADELVQTPKSVYRFKLEFCIDKYQFMDYENTKAGCSLMQSQSYIMRRFNYYL